MAKRWTVAEALTAIENGDITARTDIGRRFPLFVTATPEQILAACDISVRVIEKRLRGGAAVDLDDEDDDVVVESVEPAPRRRKAADVVVDEDDDEPAPALPKRGRRAVVADALEADDDDFAGLFDDDED